MLSEQDIKGIVDRIVEVADPEKIILFNFLQEIEAGLGLVGDLRELFSEHAGQ